MPIRHPIAALIMSCTALVGTVACAQTDEPPREVSPSAPDQPIAPDAAQPDSVGRVDVRGSGPIPMILLPHLGLSGTQFDAFMNANADRYTMHAITPAGFGGTSAMQFDDPESWAEAPRLEALEAGVARYIKDNNLDRPVILGHAMGGHVAWRLLSDHAEMFRAAIILDGLPRYPIADLADDPAERARIVNTIFAPQALTMPEAAWSQQWRFLLGTLMRDANRASEIAAEFNTVPRDVSARYYLEMIGSDISEDIKGIETPILVIAALPADTGQAMSLEERRRLWMDTTADVPGARVVFFKETGQFITEDAPDRLSRAVERFLSELEGQSEPGGDDE